MVKIFKQALLNFNKYQFSFGSHILLYHSTYKKIPSNMKEGLHNVEPKELFKQLRWIKENFEIVKLEHLFKNCNNKGKVAITFDDAYSSVFSEALPIIEYLKIPATIFVNGSSIEGKIFWRDKVRYLINNSLVKDFINKNRDFYLRTKSKDLNSKKLEEKIDSFFSTYYPSIILPNFANSSLFEHPLINYGNHTFNHYILSSLDKSEQEFEIKTNQDFFFKKQVSESKIFAIPNGSFADFNNTTIDLLVKYNYTGVLLSTNMINIDKLKHLNNKLPIANRYMVPNTFDNFQKRLPRIIIESLFE